MATISSHVLDSILGTHAAGIRVQCFHRRSDGALSLEFDVTADEQGRISETINVPADALPFECEMVFHSTSYFEQFTLPEIGEQVVETVVIRLTLRETDKNYHVPMMLSPHSYSVWWSAPASA